jgi:single-strand DNA-binding protein
MSINKAIVVGNLGRDPEVRALPSGQNVANFSVATKARFKDRNGEQQERTEWHRIVAFGKLAESCQRLLSQGRQVYVEGRLTTRQYEAKDGSGTRYRTEIVALQMRFSEIARTAPRIEGGSVQRYPVLALIDHGEPLNAALSSNQTIQFRRIRQWMCMRLLPKR